MMEEGERDEQTPYIFIKYDSKIEMRVSKL